MNGVVVKKAFVVNEDDRRKLVELMNGQFAGRNIKILEVKEESYLGGKSGHWHLYPECMYVMKGKVWDYVMENIFTGEKETFELGEGDIVFRTAGIIHGGKFAKGSIIVDIGGETYLSGEFNDVPREDTNGMEK
jgi:hypothetical protein